jgi:ribosome-binding protein aMBF1 (putative translation factor)
MPLTLAQYLDRFSWSQRELARQAKVSPHCIRRALAGETIARRNADKIVEALDLKFQKQGAKAHITLGSIHGLKIASLTRKDT